MLLTPYFTASLFCQASPSKYCGQAIFFSSVKLASFSWSLSRLMPMISKPFL